MSLGKQDGRRIQRVEKEVHQMVANFVLMKMRDELSPFVTVTRVMMPGDLKTAKVYVSAQGDAGEIEHVLETLQSRAFEMQRYLNETLSLRFCPKLKFFHDDVFDDLLKVDELLHHLKPNAALDSSPSMEHTKDS